MCVGVVLSRSFPSSGAVRDRSDLSLSRSKIMFLLHLRCFLLDFFQYSFYYFLRIGVIIRIEYDNMYFCCKFLHACIAIISMFSALFAF